MRGVLRPDPDLAGFKEAQDRKRELIGSDVTFLGKPQITWPPGTAINEYTGEPYDPTVEASAVVQPSAVVRCGVFYKAVNRGGAAQAALGSPAGWEERTRIFAIAPYTAEAFLRTAVAFVFHGMTFKIDVVKEDEIVLGYRRMLVYGAAEGDDAENPD